MASRDDRSAGRGGLRRRDEVGLAFLGMLPPRLQRLARGRLLKPLLQRLLDVVMPSGRQVVLPVRDGLLRGCLLQVDPRKQKEMILGTYEAGVQSVLARWVRPGQLVLDVGAHLGFFTLLASRLVGESGRVIALEPDPVMTEHLHANVARNGVANVTALQAAVGESVSTLSFAPGAGAGVGHLDPDGSLVVEVTTLDALAERFGEPHLLKVDVEGGELNVLRGGRATLRRARPVLIVEVHGPQIGEQVATMLRELGYDLRPVDPGGHLRDHLLAVPRAEPAR
jgi:FkbM family methyltransferase